MPDDDDVTPFAPRGVLPEPDVKATAITLPNPKDPFAVEAPVLTDEGYVRDRLQRSAYYRKNFARRPHISTFNGVRYGPTLLLDAELIERYLLNGVGPLLKAEVQFIMDVLAEPETPAPVSADGSTQARWARAVRDTINQLRVEMVRKKR